MKLLCFGEIVWDEIQGKQFIGGAPFNVAAHARILGIQEVFLFSAVGRDPLAEATREAVRQARVRDEFVKTVDADTCVVKVTLDESKNASFFIPDPTSFDAIEASDEDIDRIRAMHFDCFYFGSIAQRRSLSRASLHRLIEGGGFQHVFCDVNLRMNFYDREILEWSFRCSDTVKLNTDEAVTIGRMLGFAEEGHEDFCQRLRREFDIRWVCLTGGAAGAWICSPEGFHFSPAAKVNVVDTVGSGDAFAAAMLGKLYAGVAPSEACDFACRVGGFVASRRGAIPQYSLSEIG